MNPHPAHVPSGRAGSANFLTSFPIQRAWRLWIATAILCLLQGCVSAGPTQTSDWPWPDAPYPEPARESGGAPSQSPPSSQSPSATSQPQSPQQVAARSQVGQSLVKQAREQRVMGAYVDAAATLERAISIDAQDPVLWWELARVRLEQNRLNDAETLSQRALEYAWPEDPVYAACWELIAQARALRGDQRGAAQAREQARRRS